MEFKDEIVEVEENISHMILFPGIACYIFQNLKPMKFSVAV